MPARNEGDRSAEERAMASAERTRRRRAAEAAGASGRATADAFSEGAGVTARRLRPVAGEAAAAASRSIGRGADSVRGVPGRLRDRARQRDPNAGLDGRLRRGGQRVARGAIAAREGFDPRMIALALTIAGAVTLAVSQFMQLSSVVTNTATIPGSARSIGENHAWLGLLIAVAVVVIATVGSRRWSRAAGAALIVGAVAVVIMALAVDLPASDDIGRYRILYVETHAQRGSGFTVQLIGAAVIGVAGVLMVALAGAGPRRHGRGRSGGDAGGTQDRIGAAGAESGLGPDRPSAARARR